MKNLLVLGLLVLGLSSCGNIDTESFEECINGDEAACKGVDTGTNKVEIDDNTEVNDEQDEDIDEIQDLLGIGDGEENSSNTPFVRPESIVKHLPWVTCEEIDTVLELKECEEANIRVFEYDFIGDELDVGNATYAFKGNGDGTAIFERDAYDYSNTSTRQLVERLTFSDSDKKVTRELHIKVWQDWTSTWVWYNTVSHSTRLNLVINDDLSVSAVWISGANRDIVDTL